MLLFKRGAQKLSKISNLQLHFRKAYDAKLIFMYKHINKKS